MVTSGDSSPISEPPTRFFGRSREVESARELLTTGQVRFLTLTGPGGVGKTRLAQRLADTMHGHFADGVRFVPLAATSTAAQALTSLTFALDLDSDGDQGARPLDRLRRHLQQREMLLVLDNLEQIPDIGEDLALLLAAAPGLRVLATSRAPTGVPGERLLPVTPFRIPDTADLTALRSTAATALFIDRAATSDPSFSLTSANAADIVTICRSCDGLPLALELAAARMRILSPGELATRLDARLPMLAGGSRDLPARLQTMRHAIAWSYDLLPRDQQDLFRWLSIFVGGCGIEAVEHMVASLSRDTPAAAIDLITALVDASLVQRDGGQGRETRFVMLETIREFGRERLLAEADSHQARDAHAWWCIDFAERAGPHLAGADHLTWWRRIESELGNIRGAHAWLFEQNDAGRALRLGSALTWFWSAHGYLREGRSLFRRLIAMSNAEQWPEMLGDALGAAGNLEHWLNNLDAAESLYQRQLTLSQKRGDIPGVVNALRALGSVAIDRDDLDAASHFLGEGLALATEASSAWDAAAIANLQGIVAFSRDSYDEAIERSLAAAAGWDALDDIGHVAAARVNQARAALAWGQVRQAAEVLWLVLEVIQAEVGDDVITCECLSLAAGLALAAQNPVASARLMSAADAMLHRLGVSLRPGYMRQGDRLVAQAREILDEPSFTQAWACGQALPLADAIHLARDVTTASRLAQPAPQEGRGQLHALTEREKEVLRLIARGHSDKEIAAELGITRFTASNHVSNIRTKLDAPSRAAVAAEAARAGLI